MQAAFQQHTDNAVSKTVNFQNSATRQDVAQVYMLAYKLGCKGVTIYRDGSRFNQVLNIGKVNHKEDAAAPAQPAAGEIRPRPRPPITYGITERMKIGCGNLYVTVNYDENGICEVFTSTGKAGGCPSQLEATARLVSIALRSGISCDEILDQLRGIRCPSTVRQQGMQCTSCPDAIARVIRKVSDALKNGKPVSQLALEQSPCVCSSCDRPAASQQMPQVEEMSACPECGEKLEHEGGCVICRSCGYSKCN